MDQIRNVLVKCGKSKSEIVEGDILIANLKSRPIDGKANEELIKLLSKKFKCSVEILSGFKSKKKRVRLCFM